MTFSSNRHLPNSNYKCHFLVWQQNLYLIILASLFYSGWEWSYNVHVNVKLGNIVLCDDILFKILGSLLSESGGQLELKFWSWRQWRCTMDQVVGECRASHWHVCTVLIRHWNSIMTILPWVFTMSDTLLLHVSLLTKQGWPAVGEGLAETGF